MDNINNYSDNNNKETLARLYQNGDWRGVLTLFSSGYHEPKLLWLRPTEDTLHFITRHLISREIKRVVSLGCGTGLFEWLLAQASPGIEVVGVEVDEAWWTSPYAPPTFVPLLWADDTITQDVIKCQDTALLFCYFNCGPAWRNYLEQFNGSLIVVCGPTEGSGTHSDPQPFQSLTPEWTVVDGQKVGQSHDHVAIYARIL